MTEIQNPKREYDLEERMFQFFDELVKSQELTFFVIPAKAGIQHFQQALDAGRRSRLLRGSSPA